MFVETEQDRSDILTTQRHSTCYEPSPEWPADAASLTLDLGEIIHPADEESHMASRHDHTTGAQLRRRLITADSIAELAACEKPGLLQRILRRKQTATKR